MKSINLIQSKNKTPLRKAKFNQDKNKILEAALLF
jgi:hypothetical protein